MDVVPGAGSSETIRTAAGLVVTAYGQTDIGCKRSVNQDTLGDRVGQFAAMRDEQGLLYAVADGMGGHAHGEVASALAIDTIFARFYAPDRAGGIPRALDSALRAANSAVYERGLAAGSGPMGTTLTSVVLHEKFLYVGNIGDSRTYLIRGGRIKQLSQDHSLVGEQLRRGLLTEEQARASTIRNVITRAVGHNAQVEPDIFAFTVEAGDRLLLCSDGLHGLVENAELAQIAGTGPIEEGVRTLIALARERGGPDNITALIISIDQLGTVPTGASDEQTTPIVIGNNDDTPRVLPRLDDVEVAETGGSASDDQPTVPIPPLATNVQPAPVAPPASPAAPARPPAVGASAAVVPRGGRGVPVWLFVIVPIVIVALLVAGTFLFVGARSGARQETGQPVVAPTVTGTATSVPPSTAPAAAPPTATPPPATVTPATSGGQLPATAGTPATTKESGFIAPSAPARGFATPGSASSTAAAGQTVIVGTVTVESGVATPADFPDRWMVTFYNQADWERDQRSATPYVTAQLDRPIGQNTPAGHYTFRAVLTPPPTGGNYVVQLRHDDGTSVATTTQGVLTLAVGPSDRIQEFSFRVTGFGGGAEIGR